VSTVRALDPSWGKAQPREKWQQSPGGRVILGILLSLGLSYGLLQMGMACLRGLQVDASTGHLNPLVGLTLFSGLQALALLVGGTLAGAGQPRGALLGALVGVSSGVLFLIGMFGGILSNMVQSFSAELLTPGTPTHGLTMMGLPLQNAVIGAVGGLIGSWIWKPLPPLTLPGLVGIQNRKSGREWIKPISRWAGPISPLKVLLGTAAAVFGAINTPRVVDYIVVVSDYKLKIMTALENQVAHGEIYGLMILSGGFLAGASRTNGLKQGLCVGVLVAIAMSSFHSYALGHASLDVVFAMVTALSLATVGGWFGSELWPPIDPNARRKRWTWY
jgi:hypothetical protein